jgi:hypothetical protein
MAQDLIHGPVVSYQRENRVVGDGEYGVLFGPNQAPAEAPTMLWPGLNASFGVDVESPYAEIPFTPAHAAPNILECVRNVKLGENLPFHLEAYPQQDMEFPLLEFITGSVTGFGDEPDSISWMKELDGKYSIFSGVMFEDYKCELPERGALKETISGFAGDRAVITTGPPDVTPSLVEAVVNTSKPWVWNDIQTIKMDGDPEPDTSIAHCISDISFGFTNTVEKRVHPESLLTTKMCGVRVVARKMFVSLKLTWVDQTFIDIVTGPTKQYLQLVLGTGSHALTIEFGGLYFANFSAKAEAKELAGDTITAIVDQPLCTYSFEA